MAAIAAEKELGTKNRRGKIAIIGEKRQMRKPHYPIAPVEPHPQLQSQKRQSLPDAIETLPTTNANRVLPKQKRCGYTGFAKQQHGQRFRSNDKAA
jgi:hypothetical protein